MVCFRSNLSRGILSWNQVQDMARPWTGNRKERPKQNVGGAMRPDAADWNIPGITSSKSRRPPDWNIRGGTSSRSRRPQHWVNRAGEKRRQVTLDLIIGGRTSRRSQLPRTG